jgi:hypothetical protein
MCPNLLWRVKRQPIKPASLKALHKARNYEGMVQRIKKAMNVEVKLRVGWVNSGGQNKDAPAWVQLPHNMPPYGSTAFKDLTITIFIRKSFLERSKYDQAAITVAHELSHIVLESINHPLRREEKAVDLTAMLLGFRELYASGAHKAERTSKQSAISARRRCWPPTTSLTPNTAIQSSLTFSTRRYLSS